MKLRRKFIILLVLFPCLVVVLALVVQLDKVNNEFPKRFQKYSQIIMKQLNETHQMMETYNNLLIGQIVHQQLAQVTLLQIIDANQNGVNITESLSLIYEDCQYEQQTTLSTSLGVEYILSQSSLQYCQQIGLTLDAIQELDTQRDSLIESIHYKEKVQLSLFFGGGFIVILVLLLLYMYRISVRVILSYEVPLRVMLDILQLNLNKMSLDPPNMAQYQMYFNSADITELYRSIILLMQSMQYLDLSILTDEDNGANYLQKMCAAKNFYKECQNYSAVCTICNNIAQVHLRNKRYIEAMNEQEQCVMLANEELIGLKQMEKLRQQSLQSMSSLDVNRRLSRYILHRFSSSRAVIIVNQAEINLKANRPKQVSQILSYKQIPIQPYVVQNSDRSENIQELDGNQDNGDKQYYREQKKDMFQMLLYRKYQLAQILFKFSTNQEQLLMNELIQMLTELYDELHKDQLKRISKSIALAYLQVDVLIKKCYCFARLGMGERAQKYLDKSKVIYASQIVNKEQHTDLTIQEKYFETQCWKIKGNIQSMEALLDIVNKDYETAASKFTTILRYTKLDDIQQKFILKSLYELFRHLELNPDCLYNFRYEQQHNQLTFYMLIDYSARIADEQITIAHSLTKYIISQLRPTDQFAIFLFNETVFEVCQKQYVGQHQSIVKSSLNRVFMPSGGKCNMFEAIDIAARKFESVHDYNLKQMQTHSQENSVKEYFAKTKDGTFKQIGRMSSKRINTDQYDSIKYDLNDEYEELIAYGGVRYLCLFTEGPRQYPQLEVQRIKGVLRDNQVQLIIFNIANSNGNRNNLQQLARQYKAVYINDENETTEFFQQLRQPIFRRMYYLEL